MTTIAKVKRPRGRQDVWKAICACRERFCAAQIAELAGVSTDVVKRYVTELVRAGFVEAAGMGDGGAKSYRLARHHGREAPRVRGGAVCPPTPEENMWRTMKTLRRFTPRDLAIVATTEEVAVRESDAADYLRHLHLAGYLDRLQDGSYRLVRDTGGLPPRVLRLRAVYDPNRDELVWMDLREVSA